MLGLLLSASISRVAFGNIQPWFIAPMGASAVLLFAVPSSPLAQPWSIIGGNGLAALVGVACAHWLAPPVVAAAVAASVAIALMMPLRCLHPPSGAVALTAVLGGPGVTALGWRFALVPVLLNSALLLLIALVFNNAFGRRYPHRAMPAAHATSDPDPSSRGGLTPDDLLRALQKHEQLVDIDETDLLDLVHTAQSYAFARLSKGMDAGDIMSRDVVRIAPHASVESAQELFEAHAIKALPVIDEDSVLVGVISLRDLLARRSDDARVADVMTRQVLTTHRTRPVAELVEWFTDYGIHHLPVVDGARHLLGIITQSDLIGALYSLQTSTRRA